MTREQNDAALRTWRLELREWLEAHVPRGLHALESYEASAPYREWEQALAGAGYAAVHWPREHGGQGVDERERLVFQEEYERAGGPARVNVQGLMLAGPTLMAFGTREQQARWLPAMLTSEHVWCQGFSEPDAGSDLAALRTRARRDGDELIISGQKTWTTGAHYSDWIFALVRTSDEGRKHEGITWVMVDLRTPGVQIRPIAQLNGQADFAEVFFDDVRVPVSNVVGGIDNGWRVAMAALGFERGIGRRSHVQYLVRLQQLREVIRAADAPIDPAMEQAFGAVLAKVLMYRDFINRVAAEAVSSRESDTASYNKLLWSEIQIELFELGERILATTGHLSSGSDGVAEEWVAAYWYARAARIFAGTNEVQKNILAERVLGLPRGWR